MSVKWINLLLVLLVVSSFFVAVFGTLNSGGGNNSPECVEGEYCLDDTDPGVDMEK